MRLELDKKIFNQHLEKISRAITSVSHLPSLQGILITATESNIELIASNGTLSIREIIENTNDTKVNETGKILVPGKLFKEIINKQGDLIDIKSSDSHIVISSDGYKTNINLLDTHDYPVISFDDFGKELYVEAEKIKQLIKNISYAAGLEDKRIILNGVNLSCKDGKLKATATNSFRLAQDTIEVDSNVEFEVNIYAKNLKDFLPNEASGKIKINVEDTKIITKINSTTIASNLIDGVYPDINKLIPSVFLKEITIDSKKFNNLIDRAIVVSNDNKKVVKLTLENNIMKIESKRSEIGETEVKTEINYSGEKFEIAFNAVFLKEALSNIDSDVKIGFNGSQKPFVLYSFSKNKLIQLILPHRSF